ncbi:MAG: metal ABC transporter substrate-binding protein [Planctomycetota bacterium]
MLIHAECQIPDSVLQHHPTRPQSSHFSHEWSMPRAKLSLAVSLMMLILMVGCSPDPDSNSATSASSASGGIGKQQAATVVVTSEFLEQAGQRLAGDEFNVRKIVPDSTTSPRWRPRRSDLEMMRSAELIVMSGAGYEPWKDRVSLPDSRVVDSSSGYRDQLIRIPDAVTHQHGPEGKHSHAGFIAASWMDPDLAAAQLTAIEKAFTVIKPDLKPQFAREASRFRTMLESFSRDLDSLKARCDASKLMVASDSPAVSYLVRRLGLELKYLHWETPETPTDNDRSELQNLVRQLPDRLPQRLFLLNSRCPDSAESWVTDSGFTVARIDLLDAPGIESTPAGSEWMDRFSLNLSRLKNAIESASR